LIESSRFQCQTQKLSQKKFANVAGVSDVTIRTRANLIKKTLGLTNLADSI